MEQQKNHQNTKESIISLIRIKGPSLPVQIARATNINSIFAGAFLSELASDKTIKISNLKVGGSPLYFLPGQEEQLERFYTYLPSREKEAFLFLKEKKILEDEKLESATRVALRNIKDFALPLVLNQQDSKLLFWRFHSFLETQAKELIEKLVSPKLPTIPQTPSPTIQKHEIKSELKVETKEYPKEKPTKVEKEKPLIILKPEKKKTVEKSEFVNKVINQLESENIELVEEKSWRKKEYTLIIRINSDLGKIKFFCIAKDKKTITENDLALALQSSQTLKLPVLLISPGSLNKKVLAYLEQYSSMIKFKKLI